MCVPLFVGDILIITNWLNLNQETHVRYRSIVCVYHGMLIECCKFVFTSDCRQVVISVCLPQTVDTRLSVCLPRNVGMLV